MKGILFSILFIALTFVLSDCKKASVSTHPLPSIIGSWELHREQTGMIPTTNYSPGNDNILKFTGSQFQVFSNGQLVTSGTYKIVIDSTAAKEVCLVISAGEYRHRIIYNLNYQNTKVFVQVSGIS